MSKDSLREQEINKAVAIYHSILKKTNLDTLIEYNRVVSVLGPFSPSGNVDFFESLGFGIGQYLLRDVPDDSILDRSTVIEFFPDVLRNLISSSPHYFTDLHISYEIRCWVCQRFKTPKRENQHYLMKIVTGLADWICTQSRDGIIQCFLEELEDSEEETLGQIFGLIDEDVTRIEALSFLPKDIVRLAGQYLI